MGQALHLQPRLQKIASLVPDGARLVDVGTDHGLLPVRLLLDGRISSAIASDIGELPLDRARATAAQYDVTERMTFRLCDGLQGMNREEADTVVIAGMGGDNIAHILSQAPWTRDGVLLLLQPMSKAEVLRRFLPANGYAVIAEHLVADKGILYPILTVRGGTMPPATAAQAWGGFLLYSDPLHSRYLEERILRLRRAALGLENAKEDAGQQRREEFLAIAAELEKQKGVYPHANGA